MRRHLARTAALLLASLLLAGCPGKRDGEPDDGGKAGDGPDSGSAWDLWGGGEPKPPGLAKDGKWKGKYISFTVMQNGNEVWLHDMDYTKCTKGGCEDSTKLEGCLTACNVPIKGGAFNITKHKITGTFTSATAAKGTATDQGDFCGCTMKVDWTATWVSK